jgi:hypothetical protein
MPPLSTLERYSGLFHRRDARPSRRIMTHDRARPDCHQQEDPLPCLTSIASLLATSRSTTPRLPVASSPLVLMIHGIA